MVDVAERDVEERANVLGGVGDGIELGDDPLGAQELPPLSGSASARSMSRYGGQPGHLQRRRVPAK